MYIYIHIYIHTHMLCTCSRSLRAPGCMVKESFQINIDESDPNDLPARPHSRLGRGVIAIGILLGPLLLGARYELIGPYLALRAARSAAFPLGGSVMVSNNNVRDFKDTVYPFFESDTLFLECGFWLSV